MRVPFDHLTEAGPLAYNLFPLVSCNTSELQLLREQESISPDDGFASPERLYEELVKELSSVDEFALENSSTCSTMDGDSWGSDAPCSPSSPLTPFSSELQPSWNLLNDAIAMLCNDLMTSSPSLSVGLGQDVVKPMCPNYPDYFNSPTSAGLSHFGQMSSELRGDSAVPLDAHHCPVVAKSSRKGKKHKKIREKPNRCIHLWQFLRDLLDSKDQRPNVISWTCREEQEFRLIDTKAVAELWGMRKNRGCMTYEKMARTMRYYYKLKILERVPKKRLHFRFGKAKLWTKL